MYLLDTNVISEFRKIHAGKADKNVTDWAGQVDPSELFISVITVLELETGVLLKQRKDSRQGDMLRIWLDNHVLPTFSGRILPIDTRVAQRGASLHVPNPSPIRDAFIAATALEHKMIVVTRNVDDFKLSGTEIINPWLDF